MAIKRIVLVAIATFLISLLFFSSIILAKANEIILETRSTALVRKLSEAQLDGFGAFHYFYIIRSNFASVPNGYFDEDSTSMAISSLQALGALSDVDVNSAVEYIASTQHPKSGGFGTYIGKDGTILGFDLYITYEVVRTLKEIGAIFKINRTALIDFVLARYNQSSGGFSEPITEAYGEKYAVSWFPLEFHSGLDQVAYAIPNVISTFSGVSILSEIDALNLINATRTFDFIMSARTVNGLFKPYPTASAFDTTNPFSADGNGTGIPYIYAAVAALKALGKLDVLSQTNVEKITQYILSCQSTDGDFYIYKDYNSKYDSPWSPYTYYSVMTLSSMGMQDQAKQAILKVQNHILETQELGTNNLWPIPQPETLMNVADGNLYGVFQDGGGDPLLDTFRAVSILNVTNGISLLDQPTPRVYTVLLNFTVVSSLITVFVLVITWELTNLKKRKEDKLKPTQSSPPILVTTTRKHFREQRLSFASVVGCS